MSGCMKELVASSADNNAPINYQVEVVTSDVRGAGTDADVYLTIAGDKGEYNIILGNGTVGYFSIHHHSAPSLSLAPCHKPFPFTKRFCLISQAIREKGS